MGLIGTAHKSYGTLLKWIITPFASASKAATSLLLQTLQDFLIDQYADGKRTVVIVDEAQPDNSDLESLRLLTNINSDKNQLLQVILVGQPELLKSSTSPA